VLAGLESVLARDLRTRQPPTTERDAIMTNIVKSFIADERGATAIEYGLIAAGISLAIIAVVNGLGSNLNEKFSSINTSLK
jgi:pilus assembly protein Flp/PilA